jgi:YD repeat-containing protein
MNSNNSFFKIVILIIVLINTIKLIGQCPENFENINLINSKWTPIAYNRVSFGQNSVSVGSISSGSNDSIQIRYFFNFPPVLPSLTTHLNNKDVTAFNWQILSRKEDKKFKCLSTVNKGNKALKMGREEFSESGVEGYKATITGPTVLNFSYAMVVQDPSTTHLPVNLPFFGVRVNGVFATINHSYNSSSPTNPIYSSDDGYTIINNDLKIKLWTEASINLPSGTNDVEFLVGDCSHGGHWAYAYIDDIFCSSNSVFSSNAFITKLEGFPCNPQLHGVVVNKSGSLITDIKVGLYQNGIKKYTSSSVLSKFNPLNNKLTILDLENYFPVDFAPAEKFDYVIEVYYSSGSILFTSSVEGLICGERDAVFGCYDIAHPSNINYSRDRCGNFNLSGKFNSTVFYPGKSIQKVAPYSDLFVSTNDLPILKSISSNYNPVTKDFFFSPSYFENLILEGKFHDLKFVMEEIGAYGKFGTVLNEGIIKNSSYSIKSSRENARDNCNPKKTCQYEGPNDFFVKNNQQIVKKNTHQFVTGKCKMDVEFEYFEWTNFTDLSLVRDTFYDHRKCDTCGDTVLCYKVIEQKDLTDDCYCKFNFKKFIDSFKFAQKAPLIDCYTLVQFDSFYECNKDSMSYIIKYKLNQKYNGKDIFVNMKVRNVCDLTSCENYICKSNTGTVLNPILNNLRLNYRAQEEKLYIVKREDLSSNKLRKGESYNDFTPLYSFDPSSGWKTSTNNNWITKDFATNFDEKGNQIESKDPLNIYTSYKFGFNKSFVTSVAKNAKYKECINLSFEDEYFNVDPIKNYSNGFRKEFYLPKIGKGIDNINIKSTFDEVYNISYADVVENIGHTGNNSYFVKPFFGTRINSSFSDREPYVMKVSQLCGPNDPDYLATTYEVKDNSVNSVDNSYNPAFQLEKGKKYILSYWVKDAPVRLNQFFSFSDRGYMDVGYDCNAPTVVKSNIVKSNPVEGWQRDFFEFEVPQNANLFKLIFMPNSNGTYYDDIRIFPSNGNMKSFIYDPITLRFTAELDENNFATFYDYDEQGQLIRIRKETDRGIMTIKESRTSLKQN